MRKFGLVEWLGVAGLLLAVPIGASAAQFVVANDENESVSTSGISRADVFMAGNVVTIDDEVEDDVWAAGNLVEVTSPVGQDVLAAGQTVSITAPVGDGVMAAGELVRIQAGLVDDVMAAGQTIEITDTAVAGSVYAAGQTVLISGQVEGNVRVAADSVTIKSGSVIKGDLISYSNGKKPVIEEGATVDGEQRHHINDFGKGENDGNEVWGWVRGVIAWFLLGLILLYGLPAWSRQVMSSAVGRSGKSLLYGFLALLMFIPVFILLIISMVGWPIAIGGGLLLGGLMVLAGGFGALAVGSWLLRKFTKSEVNKASWQDALLGAIVIKGIGLVPVIGVLLVLVLFVLALGAQLLSLHEKRGSNS